VVSITGGVFGVRGDGVLDGSFAGLTVTGLVKPGETERVLTLGGAAGDEALSRHAAMLSALGLDAEAGNVAMAYVGGDSYPVVTTVPEPAAAMLVVTGLLALSRMLSPSKRACRSGRRPFAGVAVEPSKGG